MGSNVTNSNRRVRTRTHGGVAGVGRRLPPLCRSSHAAFTNFATTDGSTLRRVIVQAARSAPMGLLEFEDMFTFSVSRYWDTLTGPKVPQKGIIEPGLDAIIRSVSGHRNPVNVAVCGNFRKSIDVRVGAGKGCLLGNQPRPGQRSYIFLRLKPGGGYRRQHLTRP